MAVNSPTEKQQKLGQIALEEQVTEATEIEELKISEEDSILLCVQYIFKSGGIDRSVASIREIADISEEDEVNVLSGMYGPGDKQAFKKTEVLIHKIFNRFF